METGVVSGFCFKSAKRERVGQFWERERKRSGVVSGLRWLEVAGGGSGFGVREGLLRARGRVQVWESSGGERGLVYVFFFREKKKGSWDGSERGATVHLRGRRKKKGSCNFRERALLLCFLARERAVRAREREEPRMPGRGSSDRERELGSGRGVEPRKRGSGMREGVGVLFFGREGVGRERGLLQRFFFSKRRTRFSEESCVGGQ